MASAGSVAYMDGRDAGGGGRSDAAVHEDAAVPHDAGMATDAGDSGAVETSPDAGPPGPEPLSDCPVPALDFSITQPQAAGKIAITFSAWLTPLGVNERALVDVLNDEGALDTSYNGSLQWVLPDGAELVSASAVMAGQAEATFRFQREGLQEVEASLPNDPRSGTAEARVYTTQLPVWSLQVNASDFERILGDPMSSEEIHGTLRIGEQDHPTRLRLHGGSSRYAPKASLRFDLDDVGAVSGTYGKKLILRAEYNDKTMLRNWLGLRMFSSATSLPTPRAHFVHFRVNDRYYGVMLNVERVDSRMLERWGLPRTGSMYEADPIMGAPAGDLSPLSPDQYPNVYAHQNGTIEYTDLRTLIEDTLTLPEPDFAATIERELKVDDYVGYLALMAAIQNIDDVRKNYYLYRDPAGKVGWQVLPWDLDLSFGHQWTEANDVYDETIFSDVDIYTGVEAPERGDFYNRMTNRVLTQPDYRQRFRERLEDLLEHAVTRDNANALLSQVLRCMTPDIAADPQKRASNAEYLDRVAEIGAFLDARKAYVQSLP